MKRRSALVGSLLALALLGCPAEPRPFGLESARVSITAGSSVHVGYRLAAADAGAGPSAPTVTIPADAPWLELGAMGASFDTTDATISGSIEVVARAEAPAGATAVVLFGAEKLEVVITAPEVTLDPRESRRSTLALFGQQVWVLGEDGTVSTLALDGGVVRISDASGVRALSGTRGPVWRTLESPALDVRVDDTGRALELLAGQGEAAVRPFHYVLNQQNFEQDVVLHTDGHLQGLDVPGMGGVVDVLPKANVLLRADGVVFARNARQGFDAVFAWPELRAFEGSVSIVFEGAVQKQPEAALWLTPSGAVWGMTAVDETPFGVLTPMDVRIKDVFVRERRFFLLADDGSLYTTAVGHPRHDEWVRLPFASVRSAQPIADVALFSDPLELSAGETRDVAVRVVREGYDGALEVTFDDPAGEITVAPLQLAAGATSATIHLTVSPSYLPAPRALEARLNGAALARTSLLPVVLPRKTLHRTVAGELAVGTDGSVWRVTGTPHVISAISQAVAVTDGFALDANGAVIAIAADDSTSVVPGLPRVTALAHAQRNGQNVVLVLAEDGTVWWWGRLSPSDPFDSTPRHVAGLPRIVDVGGDGNAAALSETGEVFLIPSLRSVGGPVARLGVVLDGMPATTDRNYSVTANGKLFGFASEPATLLFFTGYALTADERVCNYDLGGGGITTCLQNSRGASYVSDSQLVLARDGTLWKKDTTGLSLVPIVGVQGIAPTR